MRYFYAFLGIITLACGFLGLFLPLIPTVPFILLSAFFFSRSSEKLHNYLLSHRIFGPMISDWQNNGAINPRAKRIATISIAAVFVLSVVLQLKTTVLIIQAVVLSLVLIFIWTRPN